MLSLFIQMYDCPNLCCIGLVYAGLMIYMFDSFLGLNMGSVLRTPIHEPPWAPPNAVWRVVTHEHECSTFCCFELQWERVLWEKLVWEERYDHHFGFDGWWEWTGHREYSDWDLVGMRRL